MMFFIKEFLRGWHSQYSTNQSKISCIVEFIGILLGLFFKVFVLIYLIKHF